MNKKNKLRKFTTLFKQNKINGAHWVSKIKPIRIMFQLLAMGLIGIVVESGCGFGRQYSSARNYSAEAEMLLIIGERASAQEDKAKIIAELIELMDSAIVSPNFKELGNEIERTKSLAQSIRDTSSLGMIYFYAATVLELNQDLDSAILEFEKAENWLRIKQDWKNVIKVYSSIAQIQSLKGKLQESSHTLTQAIELSQEKGFISERIQLLISRAWNYDSLSRFDSSSSDFHHALELASQLPDTGSMLQSLGGITRGLYRNKSWDSAIQFGKYALDIALLRRDSLSIPRFCNNLGFYWVQKGEPEKANLFYQKAFDMYLSAGDTIRAAENLTNFGNHMVNDSMALMSFKLALELERKQKNRKGYRTTLISLAIRYAKLKDSASEKATYQEILQSAKLDRDSAYIMSAREGIMNLEMSPTLFQEGISNADSGLRIAIAVDSVSFQSKFWNGKGRLYEKKGELDSATNCFNEAQKLDERNHDMASQAINLSNMGLMINGLEHYMEAARCFTKSFELSSAMRDTISMVTTACFIAEAYANGQKVDSARIYFQRQLDLSSAQKDLNLLIKALLKSASFHRGNNDYDTSLIYLRKAMLLEQSKKDSAELISTWWNMANDFAKNGQRDSAESAYLRADSIALVHQDTKNHISLVKALGDFYAEDDKKLPQARSQLQNALQLNSGRENAHMEASIRYSLANVDLNQNKYTSALDSFMNVELAYSRLKDTIGVSNCKINQCIVLQQLGKNKQALQLISTHDSLFKRQHGMDRRIQKQNQMTRILLQFGSVLCSLRRYQEAIEKYNQAMGLVNQKISFKGDIYRDIGVAYGEMSNFKNSLAYLDSSASIYRSLKEEANLAAVFQSLSYYQSQTGNVSQGRKYADSAMNLCLKNHSRNCESFSHLSLGNTNYFFEDFRQACDHYFHSLSIDSALGRSKSGVLINNIGAAYSGLGMYRDAEIYLNKAEEIYALSEDSAGIALVSSNRGDLQFEKGEYEKSLQSFNMAESVFNKVGDQVRVAGAKFGRAKIERELGKYDSALKLFDSASAIDSSVSSWAGLADVQVEKGNTLTTLARYEEAGKCFQRVLEIGKSTGIRSLFGKVLKHSGTLKVQQGELQAALLLFDSALTIFSKIEDQKGMRDTREQIGLTYLLLENLDSAMEEFRSCYAIDTSLGRRPGQIDDLLNIGKVSLAKELPDSALAPIEAALVLAQTIKDFPRKAQSRQLLGKAHFSGGNLDKAMVDFNEALQLYQAANNPKGIVEVRLALGKCHTEKKQFDMALTDFTAADSLAKNINYIQVQGYAKVGLGRTYQALKNADQTILNLREATHLLEKSQNPFRFKSDPLAFHSNLEDIYDELVGALFSKSKELEKHHKEISKNYIKEALECISKAKTIRQKEALEGVIQGSDTVKTLQRRVAYLSNELILENAKPVNKRSRERIQSLTNTLSTTEAEFNEFVMIAAQKDSTYKIMTSVPPEDFYALQPSIPDSVLVVEYILLKDLLYIITLSKQDVLVKSVIIPSAKIDGLISDFRIYMDREKRIYNSNPENDRLTDWQKDSEEQPLRQTLILLFDYLIFPISEQIAGAKVLTIIPSGSLYYLPFGALLDKRKDGSAHFLIESKSVSVLTKETKNNFLNPDHPSVKSCLIAFANPDSSLDGAQKEAMDLQGIFKGNSRVYAHDSATEKHLREDVGTCGILHFATHGFLSPNNPEESYLQLASHGIEDDGRLSLKKICQLTKLRGTTELVTLSACNTAMGSNPRYRGQELLSITKAFTQAGASSVVASLWSVSDDATRRLMVSFYNNLFSMDKARALQSAQRELLSRPAFSHPYYWSGFVLFGDYRRANIQGQPSTPDTNAFAMADHGNIRQKKNTPINQFSWPPPKASCQSKVDLGFIPGDQTTLQDVSNRIEKAIDSVGYPKKTWYAVPGGFAIAAEMESINSDGTPTPRRWSLTPAPPKFWQLRLIIRKFFGAEPGYYRVIVFVVNNRLITSNADSPAEPTEKEAKMWLESGSNGLPEGIGRIKYRSKYYCEAYIYEFKKERGEKESTLVKPSEVTAMLHLEKAQLLKFIKGQK